MGDVDWRRIATQITTGWPGICVGYRVGRNRLFLAFLIESTAGRKLMNELPEAGRDDPHRDDVEPASLALAELGVVMAIAPQQSQRHEDACGDVMIALIRHDVEPVVSGDL